jgi:Phage tail tube protein
MAARQYLRLYNESALGQGALYAAQPFTPPSGGGTLNEDFILVRLSEDNAFTMRPMPMQKPIRAVDAGNRRAQLTQGQSSLAGALSTWLYPTQAPFLANLLTLNSTSNDLPSFVCDHAIVDEASPNFTVYRRYLGCKFNSVNITGDAQSNIIKFAAQIQGSQPQTINLTSGTFPEPAASSYPSENPYLFTNFNGGITMDGAVRVEYKSFNLSIDPILDGTFNEGQFISRLKYCGRDVNFSQDYIYQSVNDRTAYEAATPQTAVSATLTAGGHSCVFGFNNAVYIAGVTDSLPLANVFYQNVSFQSFMDYSVGSDFSITAS